MRIKILYRSLSNHFQQNNVAGKNLLARFSTIFFRHEKKCKRIVGLNKLLLAVACDPAVFNWDYQNMAKVTVGTPNKVIQKRRLGQNLVFVRKMALPWLTTFKLQGKFDLFEELTV